MSTGRPQSANGNGQALHWSGRVFAAADVRQLNGYSAVVLTKAAILTPLAAEELRERGIEVRRGDAAAKAPSGATWGLGQEKTYPAVFSAVQMLERNGVRFTMMPACEGRDCDWARKLAECVAHGDCRGGVVFCSDPGLVCCVANKHAGLRAVAVERAQSAAKSALSVGPNLIAVAMPGPTFFEIRQLLHTVATMSCACPPALLQALTEVEGNGQAKSGGCKCASAK